MESPIVARYQWTVDELLESRRYHAQHICRRSLQITFKLLIFCIGIVGGLIGFFHADTDRWICGAIALGGIWYLFLRPIEVRFWVRHRFAKRPDREKQVEWQFDNDAISVVTDLSNSHFKWEAIAKCVQCAKGLLLYQTEQLYYWVPVHAFENQAAFDQVAEMARAHIKRFYYLS